MNQSKQTAQLVSGTTRKDHENFHLVDFGYNFILNMVFYARGALRKENFLLADSK